MTDIQNLYKNHRIPNRNSTAIQYQIQKQIQRTVRIPSTLYAMNLAALNVYQQPNTDPEVVDVNGTPYVAGGDVNWNQMSDRKQPHRQTVITSSGSSYGGNSTKRSLVRMRPGAMSPGGAGVDIKHNSYDRYLNRIKGKAPLRPGPINPLFNVPLPFDPAKPVYGNKTMKLGIKNVCKCDPTVNENFLYEDEDIYAIRSTLSPSFYVGQTVWVFTEDRTECQDFLIRSGFSTIKECGNYYMATILEINDTLYTVQLSNTGEIKVIDEDKVFLTDKSLCQCGSLEEIFSYTVEGITLSCDFISKYAPLYVNYFAIQT